MHSYSCNSVHFGETGQFFPGKLITTFYEVKRWNNKQKSAEIRINTFHEVERPRGTHSEDLAVSLLVNDSIKQEIKCYSRQFFQFPLKKSPFFWLPIDKVENFSKKKTKQNWIRFHVNMIKPTMTIEKRLPSSIIKPIKNHEYSGQFQVTKSNWKKNKFCIIGYYYSCDAVNL